MVLTYMLLNKSSCYTFLYFLQSAPYSQSQTVVVENPMSVDESGKLVSIVPSFCSLVSRAENYVLIRF